MYSVVSRTRIRLSAGKNDSSSPSCLNVKVGNQIISFIKPKIDLDISNHSFIQHLSEMRYLDQWKLIRPIEAATDRYLTELKPGGVPQISAGERMRVSSINSSPSSHARAVGHSNKLKADQEYLGLPHFLFPFSLRLNVRWGKERMGVRRNANYTLPAINESKGYLNCKFDRLTEGEPKGDG